MSQAANGLHDGGDEFGIPVHIIEKSDREQIRISLNQYEGHDYIDIRQFFNTPEGVRPTKKGVTLRKDLYPELLQGILLLGDALGYDPEEAASEQQP